MTEERFSLLVDGMDLPAAVTIPDTPRAALLLIPGSMNSDVDGNFAPMFPGQPAMNTHVYKDLAEQLCESGIAVLRFSKSGPGTGAVARDPDLAKSSYRFFPQRLRVAQDFWQELLRRTPTLPHAAAGHSEGSVVATQLARSQADLEALVLLSGPSKPLLQLMIWQQFAQSLIPEPAYQQAIAWAADYAAHRPLPVEFSVHPCAQLFSFFLSPQAEPYLRSLEQVDPAQELSHVSRPVLLVQGGRDASVIPANADALHAALPGAELALFPLLQHCYKIAPDDLPPQQSMLLDSDSDPAVARAIATWLENQLA